MCALPIYLAAPDLEIEILVHDLLAEAVPEAFDLDDGFAAPVHIHPISVKKTAKKASRTMTRKMPWTTAVVVRSPTSSASPSTCSPWKQPAMAMLRPKTGALMSAPHSSRPEERRGGKVGGSKCGSRGLP